MNWHESKQYCEKSFWELVIFDSLEVMNSVWEKAGLSLSYTSKFFIYFQWHYKQFKYF
jgi:hypothetical protein